MGSKEQNAAKLMPTVEKMTAQLHSWSTLLDDLEASFLDVGGPSHDDFRRRLGELRVRHGAAKAKLHSYASSSDQTATWKAFRTGIKDGWRALEAEFRSLTR